MNLSADALAGRLWLRPGSPPPNVRSSRREWAPTLGRGQPAAALPDLLAAVFTLCGGAHRVAARHAVAAAARSVRGSRGADSAPQVITGTDSAAPVIIEADRAALQLDTLREHLRRLWLDAPLLLDGSADEDAGAAAASLAGCPLLRAGLGAGVGAADARAWIEAHVLAMPAERWLASWQAAPHTFAQAWTETGHTWPARWLHAGGPWLAGVHGAPQPLLVHGTAAELQGLARALRQRNDFALLPTWRGKPAETGCWTRLADPLASAADSPYAAAWMRLVARVADIARLVAPRGEHWLAQGALALADAGEGLGWCETARGLLVHWVRLDGQGQVAECRIVAPTEWNFHPDGSFAQALAGLPPLRDARGARRARWLAAAYDPCVQLEWCDA